VQGAAWAVNTEQGNPPGTRAALAGSQDRPQ